MGTNFDQLVAGTFIFVSVYQCRFGYKPSFSFHESDSYLINMFIAVHAEQAYAY